MNDERSNSKGVSGAPLQGDFFDDGQFGVELATLDSPETRHGKHSGAELERRVAVRDAVVRLLAEGVGILRIARLMRQQGVPIGEHSILALRDRRPDLVAMEKKQLSTQLGRISKLMADSLEDRLVAGTLKPGSVDLAVIMDKKAMLDGDASLVIEHRHVIEPAHEGFLRRLEEMKRAKAELVAVDSESNENTVIS